MSAYRKFNREDAGSALGNMTELGNDRRRKIASALGASIGLIAAAFVIIAEDGIKSESFDLIGKAVFWSGLVIVPALVFNWEIVKSIAGVVTVVILCAVQAVLLRHFYGNLHDITFILLAPICVIQSIFFFMPFMLIRKLKTGIWY